MTGSGVALWNERRWASTPWSSWSSVADSIKSPRNPKLEANERDSFAALTQAAPPDPSSAAAPATPDDCAGTRPRRPGLY